MAIRFLQYSVNKRDNVSKINVALIGCGRIAGHHVRSIAATPGAQLTALCDLDKEAALQWVKEDERPCYTDYHEMLKEHPEIDVVSIATPSGMHYEHASEMIRHYRKHVCIEKPMVMNLRHGRELFRLSQETGCKVFPIYQNRFNRSVQRVKQGIADGELGDISIASVQLRWCRPQRYYDKAPWRGTFSHDGGALTNQGIHPLDIMRYLVGDVASIAAHMITTSDVTIDAENAVVASGRLASGGLVSIEVSTAARPDDFGSSVSLLGTKGTAILSGIAGNSLSVYTPEPSACEECSEVFSDAYGNGHKALYKSLLAELHGEGEFLISYEDAMSTIRLLHALYASDEQGKEVKLSELPESQRLGKDDEGISQLYRPVSKLAVGSG